MAGTKRQRRGGRVGSTRKLSKGDDRTDVIEKVDMHNDRFAAYYKAQNIVLDHEWDTFMDSLRQPLPTAFRVSGSRVTAQTLNALIRETYIPSLNDVIFEDQALPPPVQIPWYPGGLAWQFNVPKKVLRKSPEFKKFHSFLVFETQVGNISRQEAVSMLPPLFLDVEPHHVVMDMCAAPGSKTAQIIEALHVQDTLNSSSIPAGFLLANDSDNRRTHLLIHQSARLPSPSLLVTNLDASNYPSIRFPLPATNAGAPPRVGALLFDRILCDVPCSGDGTMRKNLGIWKSWVPGDGNGLHSLQLRILQRAMKMLKNSGRIVYSTCSLNPVENEAVIAAALETNRDFHLVDVSSRLPSLIRRPGLKSWRPAVDRSGVKTYGTYAEYLESAKDESLKAKLMASHWSPPDVETLNLERCLRIYPHLQDTGGFFVAVLEKRPVSSIERKREAAEPIESPDGKKAKLIISQTPIAEESTTAKNNFVDDRVDAPATSTGAGVPGGILPDKSQDTGSSFKENPYTFLSPDDPILRLCIERLHLTSSFPSANLLVRNPDGAAARSLYLVNDKIKSLIQHNDYTRLRLTSAGIKVFTKQDGSGTNASFRVLGEGLPVVLPYIKPESIILGDLPTLKTLVESYYPLCSTFEEPFRQLIESRPGGSQVVKFLPGQMGDVVLTHDLVLPVWKSNVSLSLMIDKKSKSALSLRLFGADITTASKEAAERKEKRPSVAHGRYAPSEHVAADDLGDADGMDAALSGRENDEVDGEQERF